MEEREKTWTVLTMLEWATGYFKENGIPSPRLSIEWLLADLLGVRRLDLYLMYDRPLSRSELDQLKPMVQRRSRHEPLQYITGYTEFLGCRIEVDPAVLIPRQETEQLVAMILEDLHGRSGEKLSVLDIGTGSGCIPIAIKRAREQWQCTGLDLSTDVLERAEKSAKKNDVQIEWLLGDLMELSTDQSSNPPQYDLIISNPPYIYPSEKETMEREVLDFEPHQALFHHEPLHLYSAVLKLAEKRLSDRGVLYLECNARITGEIRLMAERLFACVTVRSDYDGKERFLVVKRDASEPSR